jgi:hypothetical protein
MVTGWTWALVTCGWLLKRYLARKAIPQRARAALRMATGPPGIITGGIRAGTNEFLVAVVSATSASANPHWPPWLLQRESRHLLSRRMNDAAHPAAWA